MKRKLPKYTIEHALEVIRPCYPDKYTPEWVRKRLGNKSKITALDVLSIRAKYFRWHSPECPRPNASDRADSKLYAVCALLPTDAVMDLEVALEGFSFREKLRLMRPAINAWLRKDDMWEWRKKHF